MEKAACFGWLRRKRASANFVILQQMVSPCGLNAVFPQIFRMDTLFHMVTQRFSTLLYMYQRKEPQSLS